MGAITEQPKELSTSGWQLNPDFVEKKLPRIPELEEASRDNDKEIWLLQLPIDFPNQEETKWKIKNGPDGIEGRCKADGIEFSMSEETGTASTSVYAISGTDSENSRGVFIAPIDRRITLVRKTTAIEKCFGSDAFDDELEVSHKRSKTSNHNMKEEEKDGIEHSKDESEKRKKKKKKKKEKQKNV